MHAHIHTFGLTYTYVHKHTSTHIHTRAHAHIHADMHKYMYTHINRHMHTDTLTHTQIHTYKHTHTQYTFWFYQCILWAVLLHSLTYLIYKIQATYVSTQLCARDCNGKYNAFSMLCNVLCNQSFSVLPAIFQITTQRLINYESLAYSLGLFLTSSYNLN